jgi:uncharacterized protein (TIGR04255 family)
MNTSFDNPPLVEIVAEVRWNPAGMDVPSQNPGQPQIIVGDSQLDEFYMGFGGAIYQDGFQSVERLVPHGFPAIGHQPVCRFRTKPDDGRPYLYQVGPGLFTANATPPYKSWNEFSPVVQKGVEAVINSRRDSNKNMSFSAVSLRYIDAFRADLTQGKEAGAFLQEVLGISINLPSALSSLIAQGKSAKPFLQVQLPMDDGMEMTFSIGEGMVDSSFALIMNTTVTTIAPIDADAQVVMQTLNSARGVIHKMFVEITTPIHELMKRRVG